MRTTPGSSCRLNPLPRDDDRTRLLGASEAQETFRRNAVRVRADGMSTLDEPFSGLLVDASHGHGKRGGQHEASCFISTKVDPGDDVDIVICKAVAAIPAHMKECILKAGCIPAGEELFGIGRIAPSAKRPGQCQLEVEQTVFAADRTVTASARRDFCGI